MSAKCLCCDLIFDLGCFDSCELVETIIMAPSNDTFTFQMEFNGKVIRWNADFLIGQPFVISAEFINADYQHVFKIFDSMGTQITYTVGADVYDCFSFVMTPNVGVTGFVFPGPEIQTPQ